MGMFVVWPLLLKIVYFSLGVLKYVVCLCKGCDGYFLFVLCILQSRSHDCLIGRHECLFLFTPSCLL